VWLQRLWILLWWSSRAQVVWGLGCPELLGSQPDLADVWWPHSSRDRDTSLAWVAGPGCLSPLTEGSSYSSTLWVPLVVR
jgi:hypothetical protein